MTPETKTIDQEKAQEPRLQEQSMFVVEDQSRPAQDVLKDQRQKRTKDEAPVLFVP